MSITTINPKTGVIIKSYEELNFGEISDCIEQANKAWLSWRKASLSSRCELMLLLEKVLEKEKASLAEMMTTEMGKPIDDSVAEVEKCQYLCRYMSSNIQDMLQDEIVSSEFHVSKVVFVSTGVILSIMPWNFPLWQVFRFAIGNILAGNVVLLKHAPIVTGTANKIESLFVEAGFPRGVFTTLIIDESQVPMVIKDDRVKGVTLTGSKAAGSSVASTAGLALKKSMLELGGSDPYIVLADADIKQAASICVAVRMLNAGQVCISPKRCIVVASVYEEFKSLVLSEIKKYTYGDPAMSGTKIGPMAREDLRSILHSQILSSILQGAKLLCGGSIPDGPGYFYPPTLLVDVIPGMAAFDEELFGPVVSISCAKSENEAIDLANKTEYGLGASIFTQDVARGEKIATEDIEVGSCYVNAVVASDPRFPIGGVKNSGFGRELGCYGLREFLNIKVVCVKS